MPPATSACYLEMGGVGQGVRRSEAFDFLAMSTTFVFLRGKLKIESCQCRRKFGTDLFPIDYVEVQRNLQRLATIYV